MAIQGILCGFADPANLRANVILIGRGANYVLLVDGKPEEPAYPEIGAARSAFRKAADAHCGPQWLSVSEVSSNNVNNISEVVQTEKACYAERYPAQDDDETAQ